MKRTSLFLLLLNGFAVPAAMASPNLISNGDFSSYYSASQGGWTNYGIPTGWSGITGQIDNATVYQGAMLFATSGPRNPTRDKFYIFQSFTVADAGSYQLTFDFRLNNVSTGTSFNGAKIYLDNMYGSAPGVTPVVVPNTVFSRTYADEYQAILRNGLAPNVWHLAQSVMLDLTAGQHVLYLSSGGMDMAASSATVSFDNVVLAQAGGTVPEPDSTVLLASGLVLAVVMRGRFPGR
ncbi:hypothetical protein [Zoogloea dura]|uniref:PEP-CTERM sorting domain-containing protein n=1 Tax=Zoogloea dura TaxID=2728840 RepID=A0A848GAV5_9RHOO|nr:hypothetical protein [Zoogloea dura]NML27533.1 hypothetical protein [Zoogloea dura]